MEQRRRREWTDGRAFRVVEREDDDVTPERTQRDALVELVGQREAGATALSWTPGSSSGFAVAGDAENGVVAGAPDGRVAAIAVPMPTPATSAIPRTVQCSRRDT